MDIRKRIWEIVEAGKEGDKASKIFDFCILSLIFLNVIAVVVETVDGVQASYGMFLYYFEVFSVIVFTAEYLIRIWLCVVDERYSQPISGRLRFARRPLIIIDLLAILPFYIPAFLVDLEFIRVMRLFRLLRMAKIGRYYSKLQLINNVFKSKKEELFLSTVIMVILLVISSSLMYYCESSIQPKVFSSIPATMWWAVATLTTVGYGDVYPITALGKLLGSVIAILGIGMFALPTGILGAGFIEEIQQEEKDVCPHCGKSLQ